MKDIEIENILGGDYFVGSKIGSGGFGKVYVGTHVTTLQKVAIKVMVKKKLGDDLPRVGREIEALKGLNHQHIAQLFQIVETPEVYILVLEYCPGGEVFDYIVFKERVHEDEAREFFRQILSALCFIHERGFSHRDLKPENLLLGGKKEVKIIDFGLCAVPNNGGSGRDMRLETMCGSMAYAAPELLRGEKYIGREIDVWSFGVVLFTLVAGYLPFDGPDNASMSRAIQAGVYVLPDKLSSDLKKLIQGMLQVNPQKRLKIEHLVAHPWVNKGFKDPVTSHSVYNMNTFDMNIIEEFASFLRTPPGSLKDKLMLWPYDNYTATYLILAQKKLNGEAVHLTRMAIPTASSQCSGYDVSSNWGSGSVESIENVSNPSSLHIETDWLATPLLKNESGQPFSPRPLEENPRGMHFDRSLNLTTSLDTGLQNISLEAIATPRRNRNVASTVRPGVRERPMLGEDTFVLHPLKTRKTPEPEKPKDTLRLPEISGNLASSHGKRWVHSLERGLERMRHIMTPRSKRKSTRRQPAVAKTLHNVACGYQRDPDALFVSLQKAIEDMGMEVKQKGSYTLQGKQLCGRDSLTFILEVCQIPGMPGIVGIKRKRITGESWRYKKVVEQIMRKVQESP